MKINQTAAQLYPTFVYIQSNLSENLSLKVVAGHADLSPYHFHRTFHELVGETLKQYTLRLRLEQAAYQLKIQDESILDIALNVGFKSHETFSRAFKRWFGVSPNQFRQSFGRSTDEPSPAVRAYLNSLASDFQLSKVSIRKLNHIPVAFLRNLGPYIDVDTSLFQHLKEWADREGLFTGENLFIGVGHDDPAITPVDKVRFDLCLTVDEPFKPEGDVGFQKIGGGYFAGASYVGPFGPTMEDAYFKMVQQITRMKDVEFVGLPAIEIYRTTNINPDLALNHTDIFLPVRPSGRIFPELSTQL